jgi:hypothetical protein
MEMLGLIATQAAIALDLLQRALRARSALEGGDPALAAVARVAEALELGGPGRAERNRRLLDALADVLG